MGFRCFVEGLKRMRVVVTRLLEWDESGGVGGSDTGPTVLHRLVGDAELSQVVTNHVRL